MISLRQSILQLECEFSEIHNFLVHAPKTHDFDLEKIITIADRLIQRVSVYKLITRCENDVWELIRTDKYGY